MTRTRILLRAVYSSRVEALMLASIHEIANSGSETARERTSTIQESKRIATRIFAWSCLLLYNDWPNPCTSSYLSHNPKRVSSPHARMAIDLHLFDLIHRPNLNFNSRFLTMTTIALRTSLQPIVPFDLVMWAHLNVDWLVDYIHYHTTRPMAYG